MVDWGFPVGKWRSYPPTVSQSYRAADHHGVDIMFRRDGKDDVLYAVGTPSGSKNYFMPDEVGVYAAADATLWSAGLADTGHFVVLDHGPSPYATLYLHMSSLDVPTTKAGEGKIQISRGQRLGTIGYSPRDAQKLKHLHFEIWNGGAAESHVDPWPLIKDAPLPETTPWARIAALLAVLLAMFGLGKKSTGGNVS